MEIGYINSREQFPPDEFGAWKHCREEDIRRIVGDNNTSLKLAAMADAEKSDYKTDILPASESVLDMIRVATYIHQMPLALDMVKDASDKGYETTLNSNGRFHCTGVRGQECAGDAGAFGRGGCVRGR